MTTNPFQYFWRHPRRTGFIIFNVIVVAALFAWANFSAGFGKDGLGGLPNLMLGYTGMGFLLLAWVIAWLAWAYLVYSRHHRSQGH